MSKIGADLVVGFYCLLDLVVSYVTIHELAHLVLVSPIGSVCIVGNSFRPLELVERARESDDIPLRGDVAREPGC